MSDGVPGRRHFSVVSETYPPEINGVALTLARLVRELRGKDHMVSVVRPRQRGDDGRDAPDLTLVRGVPLPRYAGLQIGAPAGRVLRECWSRRRPDAVYVATEGPLGYSAVRAARRLGIPVVSGFHTDFHGYAAHYHAARLRPVVVRYLRRFHNRSTATIVSTLELRDRLRALDFRNLRVLGRGVDARLFTPERRDEGLRSAWGASGRDVVALHVGRLAREKNVSLAVGAYRAMARRRAGLRLVIVGDGPVRAELQRANPDVIFAGTLAGSALAAHYASADVFLFPSETETFGNVTLEALASGLAVVAYDYAAARLHITHGETGLLVPRGDARGFVEHATTLVERPHLVSRIRRHAREAVACADWRRVAERFALILLGDPERPDDARALAREEAS